jgi:UV radiation resistance-associated gene protein
MRSWALTVFGGLLYRKLEEIAQPLPDNCLLLHMSDGIYVTAPDTSNKSKVTREPGAAGPLPSSSFDALMNIKNIDSCIRDARSTRNVIRSQLGSFLKGNMPALASISAAASAKEARAAYDAANIALKRSNLAIKRNLSSLRENTALRRRELQEGIKSLEGAEKDFSDAVKAHQEEVEKDMRLRVDMLGQTRRICQELGDIFGIEPIQGQPLCFTIRGAFLPNAETFAEGDPPEPETTAAALGYVAMVVQLLERKMLIALPYPVVPRGSNSEIFDPISPPGETKAVEKLPPGERPTMQNSPSRMFPLFSKGSIAWRFRWAVFLLNRDIEELLRHNNLKAIDQRKTLANVKLLLTVLASGKGDIPARKVGIPSAFASMRSTLGNAKDPMAASKEVSITSRRPYRLSTLPNRIFF